MIGNAFFLSLREIRNNLLRAGLTTLGIVIGVAAVIAMVTLGAGATKSVTSDIASMGRNLLIVAPGVRRPGTLSSAPFLEEGDADAIAREVTGLGAVAPSVTRTGVAVLGNKNRSTQVTGSTNDFLLARDWPVVLGRDFSSAEIRAGKAVCILGETVRRDLFGQEDPIGARIRVDKISCDVIGVLAAKGQSTFGQDQDDLIVMPLHAVQRRLAGNTQVSLIWVSVTSPANIANAKAQIESLMRERRHIAPGAADDFEVNDMRELTRMVESTTGILTAFLSAVAAVSLLVGGIGIMNIMLVSVTERTREIGIRLAIGAVASEVLMQFLVEAVVLACLGGLIGIFLALIATFVLAPIIQVPFLFDPQVNLLAFSVSALIGIVFGYFPARRAAALNPIDALRHE
jgi:putative ABC transport system permease protein